MFFVNDVYRLNLSQKHHLLKRLIRWTHSWPQRISIILTSLLLAIPFYNHRNYLNMIQKVYLLVLILKILNNGSVVKISLKIFDIVLNILWFVSNRKVKSVVAQSKTQSLQTITESNLVMKVVIYLIQYISLCIRMKGNCTRSLIYQNTTFGRLIIPCRRHWYPWLTCSINLSFSACLFGLRVYFSPVLAPRTILVIVNFYYKLLSTYSSSSLNYIPIAEFIQSYLRMEFC